MSYSCCVLIIGGFARDATPYGLGPDLQGLCQLAAPITLGHDVPILEMHGRRDKLVGDKVLEEEARGDGR